MFANIKDGLLGRFGLIAMSEIQLRFDSPRSRTQPAKDPFMEQSVRIPLIRSTSSTIILAFYNQNKTIEIVQYDYFIEECPTNRTCANEFYLNVYLRANDTVTRFFDCIYSFVPTNDTIGEWHTFSINTTDTTHPPRKFDNSTYCPSSLQDAINEGFVLGGNSPYNTYILVFNMGDTEGQDAGLKGYFDNIQIQYESEATNTTYDLEPLVCDTDDRL